MKLNKTNSKKLAVRAAWGGAVVCLIVVGVQVVYPQNLTLPWLRIGGLDVGGQSYSQVQARLASFADNGQVTIKTPSRQWQAKWATLGLGVDRAASAQSALQYEWWERLVPFSSVVRIVQSQNSPLIALVDNDRLQAFAEKVVAEDKLAARDATIKIIDGAIKIDNAKNGYRFQKDAVAYQIKRLDLRDGARLELLAETVPAVRPASELQSLVGETERLLQRNPSLKVADKTYYPTRSDIGKWIAFTEDAKTKKLQVTVSKAAIKTYLEQIDREVAVAPGKTTITLLDGQEVARTAAQAGRSVAVDASIAAIESLLLATSPAQPVPLTITEVPPVVEYRRTYSQRSSGLQALIEDWEKTSYGDYGIVVRELGGAQRYAEWQPDKSMVTASTYKMFLAFVVFTKMERGEITPEQRTDMGWTVDECIREMIVNSTNPCAISLQNLVGWQTTDDMLHAAGFTATTLNNQYSGDKYTTVREETNFLLRLQAGTLMNAGHTDYLLSLMKRQIWRAGIPSGIPKGVVVADKVGLYNNWVHDVAIVYAPKGTFILGIMSRGGSDPQFADLARRVYNFFNQ